jgi:diguanylate cyclase (GGDEF)-like protein
MRRLLTTVLPGGLLLALALEFLRPGGMPNWMDPYVRAYPYVVAGTGVILGWVFNRSRVVFAIIMLALADRALLQFGGGGAGTAGVGRAVFDAVALLLPLNLAAYALIDERGVANARGLGRLVPILAQCLVVAILCLPAPRGATALLEHEFFHADLAHRTLVPQPALLAFTLVLILQGVRVILRRNAIDGAYWWAMVASFVALHGSRIGWVGTNYFATAGLALVVALFETSYRMAYQDDLTGLPGRRALNEALMRLGKRYAVAMVDIDHFKQFNDRYGHDVGDQALRMVASKLQRVTGGGKAFRYGGEEFAVIFAGQSTADALPHLESLRKEVQATCFVLRGADRPRKKPKTPKPPSGPRRAVLVTVSIGVAEADDQKKQPKQVIQAADMALYSAKQAGRNRVKTQPI